MKFYTFKILIVFFLPILSLEAFSQSKFSDDLKIMINYHTGYNIPEYQFIRYLTEDYVRSIDLCILKETKGKNYWENLYNYPEYGISIFHSSLGNSKVFGNETALTYFFKLKIINQKLFNLYNRTGIGVSYTKRKFDIENNYMNVAIGSNFNLHFNFRIGSEVQLTNKMMFNLGASFNHYSNANTSEPNLGINYLTGYGGLIFNIGNKSDKIIQETPKHEKKNNIECLFNIGGKHTRALMDGYYFTSSLAFDINREYSRTFYLGSGIDLFYDSSLKSQLLNANKKYKESFSLKTGIHVSQIFVYNRFNVIIQEGMYVLLTDRLDNKLIYNKGIIKYWIKNDISIQLSMKSHLQVLDYPEIGISYRF